MTDHDTREKLEEDVQHFVNVYCAGHPLVYDKVIELLDRQAAITARECSSIDWWAKVEALQDERDELLAMLDEKDELLGSATRNLDESLDDLKDMGDQLTDMENQRDELQAKLDAYDETHIALPVDADGVPIKVGDKMQYHGGEPFTVCAVAPGVIHTWAAVKLGERKTTYDYAPIQCTHYKPRTIEDVLADLQHDTLTSQGEYAGEVIDIDMLNASLREQVREAAAELRELMEAY